MKLWTVRNLQSSACRKIATICSLHSICGGSGCRQRVGLAADMANKSITGVCSKAHSTWVYGTR